MYNEQELQMSQNKGAAGDIRSGGAEITAISEVLV